MKKSKTEKIVFIIVFVLFVIYSFCILYPLLFAFNASLKANGRAFNEDTIGFAKELYFKNYLRAFKELNVADNNFFQMIFNSIWFAGGSTIISLFCSTMTAYVIAKYKFGLRKYLYVLAIFIMIIPVYGSLPATYRLYYDMGLIDSPLILITATGGFGFNFIILYSFFRALSWSYAEAAFIDGANHYKVFFKIMLPMVAPSMMAIAIIAFVGSWNNYESPFLFLPNMPTLASGLWAYQRKIQHIANQPVYFAGVFLSLIPVVTIFLMFQNTIMEHIYAGGLKG